MRIEKINDNKIKVLIDAIEAKEWNISFESISKNTPEVQEMFWTAIRLAEENADFSVDGAKLFIEALQGTSADKNDGFGMMITRICSEAELDSAINNCSYKGKIRQTTIKYNKEATGRTYIYSFKDFDSVCAAAGEIFSLYTGESSLRKFGDKFYLHMVPKNNILFRDVEMQLLEFGFKVSNPGYVLGRLNEYGETMINENAVDVMAKYF